MSEPRVEPLVARVGLWAAQLKQHGQIDDAAAEGLNRVVTESFAERLDEPEDPLLVAMLCGPTAVGKSSLINALAGAPISRPGLGATTGAAVLYVHEDDDASRLLGYSQALSGRNAEAATLVRHRREALRHKVIVDTPDIDSVRHQHRALTAALVHSADLVLFVTSPEKYKVLQAARWILEQRGQRALAFALNKWDRGGLGIQVSRRETIARDFRQVLAGEGFSDPLIFKVSAETGAASGEAIENDLPALREWLEAGLDQSTANSIRQRRLRAAWGRLAAAIEAVVPTPMTAHPLLPAVRDTLAQRGALAEQAIAAEAVILPAADVADAGVPLTPGVLGMWLRGWRRLADAVGSIRSGIGALGSVARRDGGGAVSLPQDGFGVRHVLILSQSALGVLRDATAQGFAARSVDPVWVDAFTGLERDLAALPLDTAAELAVRASRMTVRRVIGITLLYGMEAVILAVLLTSVYRAGSDFIDGTYAPASLLGTMLTLLLTLVLVGQVVATTFFPPLRQRLRRLVAQQARRLVTAALTRTDQTLMAHVETVDRLASEGQALLTEIERVATGLIAPQDPPIGRLFAETPALLEAPQSVPDDRAAVALTARRPRFD